MKKTEYTVLDIETTGLSKHRHKITEIAAVKIKGRKVLDEFQTLVNPGIKIPAFITRLTGIDNEMVKNAPKIKKALGDFLKFLGPTTIVAHNATFDYGFISHNAKKHLKKNIKNKKLCTRKLANRLLPEYPRKRLVDLCELFKIKNKQAHRAMSDTKATVKVFQKFLSMLNSTEVKTHDDLIRFEKNPIKR